MMPSRYYFRELAMPLRIFRSAHGGRAQPPLAIREAHSIVSNARRQKRLMTMIMLSADYIRRDANISAECDAMMLPRWRARRHQLLASFRFTLAFSICRRRIFSNEDDDKRLRQEDTFRPRPSFAHTSLAQLHAAAPRKSATIIYLVVMTFRFSANLLLRHRPTRRWL